MKPTETNRDSGMVDGPSAGSTSRRMLGVLVLVVLAAVAVGVIVFAKKPGQPINDKPATTGNQPATPVTDAVRERLPGQWVRPDGGYVLEIKKVNPDGKMETAYYNPRPINVSKAEVSQQGSLAKLMVELRDEGYPGCLYTLLYDPIKDEMKGTYYQAAMGQTYEISFVRLKE